MTVFLTRDLMTSPKEVGDHVRVWDNSIQLREEDCLGDLNKEPEVSTCTFEVGI